MRKKAFISFDFDNDLDLKNLLVGQSQHPDTPFDISDWSIKKPFPADDWEARCLERIKKTDVVIIMIGEKTHQCTGVLKEIAMAKVARIPYFGLHGRNGKTCPCPQGLDTVYSWTWENVKTLINGGR